MQIPPSLGDDKRVDVVMTNPPFGGEEEEGIKSGFPAHLQTSETALLFLQLIMRRLWRRPQRPGDKPGGRAAVVVPNGTLFGDGVCAKLKKELLEHFNLHTIVRLPNGVFAPYTPIPTNILFFDRSGPTKEIWFYEIVPPEGRKNYSKTKPMSFEEFADCIAWFHPIGQREEGERAWKVRVEEVLKLDKSSNVLSANLDLKNPNAPEALEHRSPEELIADILEKERRIIELMEEIQAELQGVKA